MACKYIKTNSLLFNLLSECGIQRFLSLMTDGVLTSEITASNVQAYTSGATVTIADGVNSLYIDPASLQNTLNIVLHLHPAITGEVQIFFGGTLASGTVIQSLTVAPNSGQALVQATTPSLVEAGESLVYQLRVETGTWYRKN